MLQIGLIGYGAFGKLIVKHLSSLAHFEIYDPALEDSIPERALSCPVIILAIPAQHFGEFLRGHAQLLSNDALYVDVASVKTKPVEAMRELLPSSASIIATHPLFGPATAADSLSGRKIMIHPVRVDPERYEAFKEFLAKLELTIIEATPEDHDRAMAYVQGMSHYIGRIMQHMDIPTTEFATRAYEDLYDMKMIQGNDSDELFNSILHENPYTQEVLDHFERSRVSVRDKFGV